MATQNGTRPARLDRIQALRGLAALAVMIAHLAMFEHLMFKDHIVPPGASLGWIGVDVFFVISGFIIARSALGVDRGGPQALGFFLARAARIYPPWWVAFGATVLLASAWPALLPERGDAPVWASAFLLPAGDHPLLIVGWTLVMEMYFYAVFALLMLAPKAWRLTLLGMWAGAVTVGSLLPARADNPMLQMLFNPLCWQFVFGVVIARLTHRPVARPLLWAAAAAGALGLLATAAFMRVTGLSDGAAAEWVRALGCGLPAALIVWAFAALDRQVRERRPHPALVEMGDQSYALYLVHFPILSATSILLMTHPPTGGLALTALYVVGGVSLSLLASTVLNRMVERPAQRWSGAVRRAVLAAFVRRGTPPVNDNAALGRGPLANDNRPATAARAGRAG